MTNAGRSIPAIPDRSARGVVRRAASRIFGALESESRGKDGLERVRMHLDHLVAEVEAHLDRPGHTLPEDPFPPDGSPALYRRLTDQMTERVVRELVEGGEETEPAREALGALLPVRSSLRAAGTETLAGRLAQPDALDLVVEIAHDFRSPLTSILFLAESLRSGRSGEVNERQRSQLGLIYSAALGLNSVATNLLDLADGDGGAEEDPEPFSMVTLLEEVRTVVLPMAEEKGVDLRFHEPEVDRVVGCPLSISRVVLNLLTNALKFTNEGWVELTVQRVNHQDVEFSVQDTGRGLTPEAEEKLFQFFRAAQNRRGHFFSGSGLGLSIVRRILTALGTELQWQSTPGHGTRFYFVLRLPPARTF